MITETEAKELLIQTYQEGLIPKQLKDNKHLVSTIMSSNVDIDSTIGVPSSAWIHGIITLAVYQTTGDFKKHCKKEGIGDE